MPLAEIVAALEDGAGPLAEKAFGLTLDGRFGLFGLGVEEDDLADARGNEGFLVDRQLRQAGEEFALDVVGREGAVGEGLEEEADALEEVVLGVDDGRFDFAVVAVKERGNFGEEAELVHRWFGRVLGAGVDVHFGGFGHPDPEGGNFFIGERVDVLWSV